MLTCPICLAPGHQPIMLPSGRVVCPLKPVSEQPNTVARRHAAMILRGCFASSAVHGVVFESSPIKGEAVDTFAVQWAELEPHLREHWEQVAHLVALAFAPGGRI